MYNSLWYDLLSKPPLTPPAGIFLPVWIFLYSTIVISLILYIVKPISYNKQKGIIYFILHILLNIFWSPAFFILKNIGLGLIILILMIITGILMFIEFFRVSKLAGYILIPYFLWIFFALYLNIGFFVLN